MVAFYQKYVDEQSKQQIKDALLQFDRTLLVADPRRCEPKKWVLWDDVGGLGALGRGCWGVGGRAKTNVPMGRAPSGCAGALCRDAANAGEAGLGKLLQRTSDE